MPKLNPKVVIFDLGSTLIDFPVKNWNEVSRECSLAGRKLLCEIGCNLPDEKEFIEKFEEVRTEYREMSLKTHQEWTVVQAADKLLKSIGVEPSDKHAEKFFNEFYGNLEKYLYIYDDTIEVLSKVKDRYGVVGLISNTIFPERVHKHEFERFGLNEFFDFKVFSSTFGLRKPHPEIFMEAARLAGANPGDCLYIGDRFLEDVRGSQGAGMSSVLKVMPGWNYPQELPKTLRKISCLSDLREHLDI
jgi:HAD superfamily hydrolase (TIGR01549 family)